MSTTRPLLGMKRITDVTCTEPPPGGRQSPTASKTQPEQLTVDEFAVHENKQGELKCAKPRVEKIFQVTFTIIGLLDHTGAHGSKASRQIWLQLKGIKDDVSKAKVNTSNVYNKRRICLNRWRIFLIVNLCKGKLQCNS